MAVGSTVNGRFLDFEYQRIRRKVELANSENNKGASNNASREENFPLERVSIRKPPWSLSLY